MKCSKLLIRAVSFLFCVIMFAGGVSHVEVKAGSNDWIIGVFARDHDLDKRCYQFNADGTVTHLPPAGLEGLCTMPYRIEGKKIIITDEYSDLVFTILDDNTLQDWENNKFYHERTIVWDYKWYLDKKTNLCFRYPDFMSIVSGSLTGEANEIVAAKFKKEINGLQYYLVSFNETQMYNVGHKGDYTNEEILYTLMRSVIMNHFESLYGKYDPSHFVEDMNIYGYFVYDEDMPRADGSKVLLRMSYNVFGNYEGRGATGELLWFSDDFVVFNLFFQDVFFESRYLERSFGAIVNSMVIAD